MTRRAGAAARRWRVRLTVLLLALVALVALAGRPPMNGAAAGELRAPARLVAAPTGGGWQSGAEGEGFLPIAAQDDPATASLAVTRDEATADFPAGISFTLAATAPFPVERVELLYRPVGAETLRLALPDLPPDPTPGVAIAHQVDLRDGELPPGLDLRYRWRLLGAGGRAVETAERTVAWRDDRFGWERYAGERATVHAYGGAGFAGTILEATEREIARLEALYGAVLPGPAEVWIYASGDDLGGALRPNSEEWVAGAAYPRYRLILAVVPEGNEAELERVIPHEVSHLVLAAATENPFSEPPAWLDEGLAVLQEAGADGPYLALVRQAQLDGELDGLPALAGLFPYDTAGAQLAYAESLSVVAYIRDRYGDAGIGRLVAAFREPVTAAGAVRRALGVSLPELEAGWRGALAAETGPFAGIGRSGERGGRRLNGLDALLAASGTLVMAVAAVLAVVVGVVVLRRSRRTAFPDEDEGEGADGSTPAPPAGTAARPPTAVSSASAPQSWGETPSP